MLHGRLCFAEKQTKQQYSFAEKQEVVDRFIVGESKMDLAREFGLSSAQLVKDWVRAWRFGGNQGVTS